MKVPKSMKYVVNLKKITKAELNKKGFGNLLWSLTSQKEVSLCYQINITIVLRLKLIDWSS